MKLPVFTGSSVAIVTPFRDGKVDYKKLGELIDFQIAGGSSAITICGTTGESSTQSLEEHIAGGLLRQIRKQPCQSHRRRGQ